MLKTTFCRVNLLSLRNLARVTKNFGAIQHQFNKERERTNGESKQNSIRLAYAAVPTYLAFFRKNEEEEPTKESFLDKILPEEIALLLKKKPVQDETTPEGMLTTTIKRTILCIQRQQFEKAEQMAHLALRMAQDIQHYDGITLCYDIMANLAFDREQYQKAQNLFEDVLQRLLQKGVEQDDIQV